MRLIILILFLGTAFSLNAQQIKPEDVRFNSQLKQYAKAALRQNDPHTAIKFLSEYCLRRPKNTKIRTELADLQRSVYSYKKAADNYLNVYRARGTKQSDALYHAGDMLMQQARYDTAYSCFEEYLQSSEKQKDTRLAQLASVKSEACKTALKEHYAPFGNINQLGAINNMHLQTSPLLYAGNTLVYATFKTDTVPLITQGDSSTAYGTKFQAVEISKDGSFSETKLPAPFQNIPFNNVAGADFSPDGKRMYFTVREINFTGKAVNQIYVRRKLKEKWSEAEKLSNDINLSNYNSSQPTVAGSYDPGLDIIYFSSDREKGIGGYDIWYTVYNSYEKKYTRPQNAGPQLNTAGDERSPFFDKESQSLYYSTDGRPGYGGLDIFKTHGNFVNWAHHENIGPEVNSPQHDLYYAAYPKQNMAFFISNRDESIDYIHNNCCFDIFEYYEPDTTIVAYKAALYERNNDGSSTPLSDAVTTLCVKNNETASFICYAKDTTDLQGQFGFQLNKENNYRIKVEKTGYLTDEIELPANNLIDDTLVNPIVAVHLKKIHKEAVRLENIYFEFNAHQLTTESREVIDSTLFRMMRLNPGLIIEISAHTDNKGTAAYNMELSKKRSESVAEYLEECGIDRLRIKPKGYGMTAPVAPAYTSEGEDNPTGRQLNRRVEFKILGENFSK